MTVEILMWFAWRNSSDVIGRLQYHLRLGVFQRIALPTQIVFFSRGCQDLEFMIWFSLLYIVYFRQFFGLSGGLDCNFHATGCHNDTRPGCFLLIVLEICASKKCFSISIAGIHWNSPANQAQWRTKSCGKSNQRRKATAFIFLGGILLVEWKGVGYHK